MSNKVMGLLGRRAGKIPDRHWTMRLAWPGMLLALVGLLGGCYYNPYYPYYGSYYGYPVGYGYYGYPAPVYAAAPLAVGLAFGFGGYGYHRGYGYYGRFRR